MGEQPVGVDERVGVAIKTWARARNVKLTTLYTELPMSKQSFYERLRGVTPWRLAELERIAARLSVSVPDLLQPPLPPASAEGIEIIRRHPSRPRSLRDDEPAQLRRSA